MATELDHAIELLCERLSPRFVARMGRTRFCENLLDHLRTRRGPALFFSPGNLTRIGELSRRLDPDEYAWERRIADEAVEGRLYAASHPYCERFLPVDRERFDFTAFDHPDPQSIHGLNRMRWLPALAKAYWADRQRKYFDALLREWDFFAERVPPPTDQWMAGVHRSGPVSPLPPYSELDSYIRLANWWWAFWLSLWAEEMTAERCAILLARCLCAFDAAACRGIMIQEHNFTSMQMEALFMWAAALPEATGMNLWRTAARTNLQSSLNRAVLPDGGQWEMSISYQIGCVHWYGAPALLAARQGEPWPEAYTDRIVAMAEMADRLVLPDGSIPALGDSDRTTGWQTALAIARSLRPAVRFTHPAGPTHASLWRTDGQVWDAGAAVAPEPARVFPDTGLSILRAGEGSRAAIAIMKNSMRRASHAHEDNLSVMFDAFGLPVVVDAGRWIYDGSADRMWVVGAVAHNVPWISDRPLSPSDFDPAAGGSWRHERWFHLAERTGGAMVDTSAAGVEGEMRWAETRFRGFVADRATEVARRVWMSGDPERPWLLVIDRIRGAVEHSWTNCFLLPAEAALLGVDAGRWHGALAGSIALTLVTVADRPMALEQEGKFWCPNYAQKEPALWLRFGGPVMAGLRAFAFVPTLAGAAPAVNLELADGRAVLALDGRERACCAAPRES